MGDRVGETLAELVELESRSGDEERLTALRDVLVAKLSTLDAAVRVREGGHLDAQLGSGDRHVLAVGHYDTVWPVGRLPRALLTTPLR